MLQNPSGGILAFIKTRGTQNLRGCQWTLLSLSGLPAIPLPAVASTFRSSVSPVVRPLSQGTSSLSPVFTLPPPYPHPHTWKCQAASFPAFTWLWLRPLLSLKVCSPPSATPVSHSCKQASIQGSPACLRNPTPNLYLPIQRSGFCSR